jgi:uncharacterized lipoprotein YehR (DUF1307 family)
MKQINLINIVLMAVLGFMLQGCNPTDIVKETGTSFSNLGGHLMGTKEQERDSVILDFDELIFHKDQKSKQTQSGTGFTITLIAEANRPALHVRNEVWLLPSKYDKFAHHVRTHRVKEHPVMLTPDTHQPFSLTIVNTGKNVLRIKDAVATIKHNGESWSKNSSAVTRLTKGVNDQTIAPGESETISFHGPSIASLIEDSIDKGKFEVTLYELNVNGKQYNFSWKYDYEVILNIERDLMTRWKTVNMNTQDLHDYHKSYEAVTKENEHLYNWVPPKDK